MLSQLHSLAAILYSLPCRRSFQVHSFVNVEWQIVSSCSIDGEFSLTLSVSGGQCLYKQCCSKHLVKKRS